MQNEEVQPDSAEMGQNILERFNLSGKLSGLICPACGGALWEQRRGTLLSFECHVGHTFLPENLLDQQAEEIEHQLWSALRSLKERAKLFWQLANEARQHNNLSVVQNYEQAAQHALQRAEGIRQVLLMDD